MPNDSGRTRRLLVWASVIVVVVGLPIGYVLWGERNTAHIETEFVVEFAEENDAVLYCGNGYGLGLLSANEHPWWEWTILGRTDPERLAVDLEAELTREGFDIRERQVGDDETVSIAGRAVSGMTVRAEIASEMPQNNCFPDFGDLITDVDPADYEAVAVVMFRDEGRSR